jgi:murein DD-endopeptidase
LSVLRPISNIGNRNAGRLKIPLIFLVVGIAIGGLGGYFLGQKLAFQESAKSSKSNAGSEPITEPTGTTVQPPVADQKPVGDPGQGAVVDPTDRPPDKDAELLKNSRRIDASVSGSLYATLAKHIEGREADVLNAHLGRIMVWWFNLRRDVLKNDHIRLLYLPAENPEDLRILVLHYKSRKLNKSFYAYYFKPEAARYGHYYDKEGQEVELRLVQTPIEEYDQITERMNLAGRRHNGVDFKVDIGTPIKAPFKSRVQRRNWSTRLNGNCLELLYLDSGIHALFLHLDKVLPAAKPGQVIAAGTEVAHTGNSGRSTAPHLHYELHGKRGKLLDPFVVNETTHLKLEGQDAAKFKVQRDKLDKILVPEESARESSKPPSGSKH